MAVNKISISFVLVTLIGPFREFLVENMMTKDKQALFYIFLILNNSHEKTKTGHTLVFQILSVALSPKPICSY